jgi:hypothetical protein
METTPSAVVAVTPQEEPLLIYGPPGELRGTLHLHNPSQERIRVLGLQVEVPELRGPAGAPVEALHVGARLEPRQQSSVQALLRVDPSTPPGTYQGWLVLGEKRQPLRVHVCEDLRARIEPRQLTLFTKGQTSFETSFVMENLGNVPFRTGSLCVAPLIDATRFGDPLLKGLGAGPEREPQQVFRDLLVAWAEQQAGVVKIFREDVLVEPGRATVGKARIELPHDLKPHRHYYATLEMYAVSGRIDVYADQMPEPPSAPRERKPGSRS